MTWTIRKIGQRMRNTIAHRAIILAYHRVCPVAGPDPFRLSVSVSNFEDHLRLLASRYEVLSLAELADRLAAGRLARRSVVLTFDDGYVDNLVYAKPLLERFNLPATVFVTSGCVGRPWFWWDRLLEIVMAGPLPSGVRLQAGADTWTPTVSAAGAQPDEARAREEYLSLWRFLRRYPLELKESLIEQLALQLPRASAPSPEARPCTPDELRRLAEGRLASIGAHSVTHPVLSGLPVEEQLQELRKSRLDLEALIQQPVLDLSYPHGTSEEVDESTVAAAKEAGYRSACTAVRGVVELDSGLYKLPRIVVPDQGSEEFGRLLNKHFTWTASPSVATDRGRAMASGAAGA